MKTPANTSPPPFVPDHGHWPRRSSFQPHRAALRWPTKAPAAAGRIRHHFRRSARPDPQFHTPAGAVDLTEIEIPVEAEPATTLRTLGSGIASFYGTRFAGRRTASGERFNPQQLTAAHKTLPFGTMVLVTNPSNGKSVTVRINDRGPYAHGRSIDLSRAAAEQIGLVARGHGTVEMAVIDG